MRRDVGVLGESPPIQTQAGQIPRYLSVVAQTLCQLCERRCGPQRLCVYIYGETGCARAYVHSAFIQQTVPLGRKLRYVDTERGAHAPHLGDLGPSE